MVAPAEIRASKMTTPANLTYTDILTRISNTLRIPTTNTTETTKIGAILNAVYRDICAKKDWWWLEKRTVVTTLPNLIAGAANVFSVTAPVSATVTINSTAVTFLTAITQSVAGFLFLVPGGSLDALAAYRVESHVAGTAAAVLDSIYTNATSTNASFQLYKDTYSLPADCGKLLYVKRYGERMPVRLIGKNAMAEIKINDTTTGKPEVATVLEFATIGDPTTARQLVVHPYPDKAYRLEILYKQSLNTELATTVQPFIPDDYRELLTYGALARGYPIFMNDVERGKYFQQLFNDLLALMSAQQTEYASDHSAVAPDDSYRRSDWSRSKRASSYTLGSLFDRFPSDN